MVAGLLLCLIYGLIVWAVFFKFKWLKFSISWALVSAFVGVHLLIIFLVGLRFMTPSSSTAHVVQYTVQLTPRLPQPALLTEVLVKNNEHVKKGEPLFRFDARPYRYALEQAQATLAQAEQNAKMLKANVELARAKVSAAQSKLRFAQYQQKRAENLANRGADSIENKEHAQSELMVAEGALKEAKAELQRSELALSAEINGVNPAVAQAEAAVKQAQYNLDQTTIYAPADGQIVNLQARPGMIVGIIRAGAIATFIEDKGRYLLATYNQEQLKYMKVGQPVEIAMELYPGQIFKGTVAEIWRAHGSGQYKASGRLPNFYPKPVGFPQGQFGVKIKFEPKQESLFPIGAGGVAAIYTEHTSFYYLRKIVIRSESWYNWLYPFS